MLTLVLVLALVLVLLQVRMRVLVLVLAPVLLLLLALCLALLSVLLSALARVNMVGQASPSSDSQHFVASVRRIHTNHLRKHAPRDTRRSGGQPQPQPPLRVATHTQQQVIARVIEAEAEARS
jgi:hypothetical protein